MNLLLCFSIGLVLSLLGSIPINMITLSIIQQGINKGEKAALKMAYGASIPQLIYTYLTLYSFDFFHNNLIMEQQLQTGAGVIFIGLSFYFFRQKIEEQTLNTSSKANTTHLSFTRGLIISFLNVLVIPFWIFIAVYLGTYGIVVSTQSEILLFSIGSALGALVTFIAYAKSSEFIIRRIGKLVTYTNKIAGVIFLLLGIYQFM